MDYSIVIPVFNDLSPLKKTLEAIQCQRVDAEFEVIVVDNGSEEDPRQYMPEADNQRLLVQTDYPGSPYSSRNRGIEQATGNYIVLLDATCTPDTTWLSAAHEYIERTGSKLFGGAVVFDYEGKVTAGKVFDSVTNVQMKTSIEERREAKTANLWVHRSLFEKHGYFREGVRSGEDVRWTKHCTSAGEDLSFSSQTIVKKPARGFFELVKKQYRVGKGQVGIWRATGSIKPNIIRALKKLAPMRRSSINQLLERAADIDVTNGWYLKIYIVSYLAGIATLAGNISGYCRSADPKASHLS